MYNKFDTYYTTLQQKHILLASDPWWFDVIPQN